MTPRRRFGGRDPHHPADDRVRPPRPGDAFLRATLPPGVAGDSIRADLDEEYRARRASSSRISVDAWHLTQAFGVGMRFGVRRISTSVAGFFRGPGVSFWEHLLTELRQGLRLLARSRGTVLFASLAMGLGIGATATMFSISHGLLRDLPYVEPSRLAYVGWQRRDHDDDKIGLDAAELRALRASIRTLRTLSAVDVRSMDLAGAGGTPERVSGALVTTDAFTTLGVRVALGRGFTPQDAHADAPDVVILGHGVWMRRFGGDPDVLGRTVRVNGAERTIVGVMPKGFRFPEMQDIWIPLRPSSEASVFGEGPRVFVAFGRLRKGVTLEAARTEVGVLAAQLASRAPEAYRDLHPKVTPYHAYFVGRDAVVAMDTLVVISSFVLLIACAGVANLLLARALARRRELAVRSALGASRRRIVGQLLVESLLIATAGGVVGVALAELGVWLFNRAVGNLLPFFWMACRVDGATLAFSVILVILAGVGAGVAPALRATATAPADVLKQGERGSSSRGIGRLSRGLVAAEVALSFGLLVLAGMMAKGPLASWHRGAGETGRNTFVAQIALRSRAYPDTAGRHRFFDAVLTRVAEIPGVRGAALATSLPGVAAPRQHVRLQGVTYQRNVDVPSVRVATVSSSFFTTLGVKPLQGRLFESGDRSGGAAVAVVNQSFARRFFPDGSPVGRQILPGRSGDGGTWRTVVGVVPDLRMNGGRSECPEGIYLPMDQQEVLATHLLIATDGDPLSIAAGVRQAIAGVDPDVPLGTPQTLAQAAEDDIRPEATFASLVAAFGAIALVLAAVSLFGVMAFTVGRHTREIGIRRALGARAPGILWRALRGSVAQMVFGLTGGLALTFVVAPFLQSFFVADRWMDPPVYAAVAGTLLLVGIVASVVPALRALRVSPVQSLREE